VTTSLQIAGFVRHHQLSSRYRPVLVSHTDWFWSGIPMVFGYEYRSLLVSFTDSLWLEIPISCGQFYRLFMVSRNCEVPAKRGKIGVRGGVALYVCLFV
jgi:hypothetical protein